MKKIISFSLYGNKPNFQVGAVVNVLEAKRLYPDWKCRFYTTDDESICKQLEYLGAEIVRMDDHWMNQGYSYGSLWRFLAVDDADICIFRDTDSVVNERELGAVNEWLATDKQWHIMHDHRHHANSKIMAGMFGYRSCQQDTNDSRHTFDFKSKDSMLKLIKDWLNGSTNKAKDFDQNFLANVIHPRIQKNLVSHGLHGQPFPEHTPCRYGNFVGDYSFWVGGWKGFVYGDRILSQMFNEKNIKKHTTKSIQHHRKLNRAIVASDSHPDFLGFWPLIAAAWEKIDVKPTLILIEKFDEDIEVDETVGDVKKVKLPDDSLHSAFCAQTARLLAPCLYPDEVVTIADIDIVPLSHSYFNDNIQHAKDTFIELRHGMAGHKTFGPQIPICWNVATGSTWSEIFGVCADMQNYESVFLPMLRKWFPDNYKTAAEEHTETWHTDQKILYDYVNIWSKSHAGRQIKLTDGDTGFCRLNHRAKRFPRMHDNFTDFCPRRPPEHNLAYRGCPDSDNINSIKEVFDWYEIPWKYHE